MPSVDQEAGAFDRDHRVVLRRLVEWQRYNGDLKGAFFGNNAIIESVGSLRVGDGVQVLSER